MCFGTNSADLMCVTSTLNTIWSIYTGTLNCQDDVWLKPKSAGHFECSNYCSNISRAIPNEQQTQICLISVTCFCRGLTCFFVDHKQYIPIMDAAIRNCLYWKGQHVCSFSCMLCMSWSCYQSNNQTVFNFRGASIVPLLALCHLLDPDIVFVNPAPDLALCTNSSTVINSSKAPIKLPCFQTMPRTWRNTKTLATLMWSEFMWVWTKRLMGEDFKMDRWLCSHPICIRKPLSTQQGTVLFCMF